MQIQGPFPPSSYGAPSGDWQPTPEQIANLKDLRNAIELCWTSDYYHQDRKDVFEKAWMQIMNYGSFPESVREEIGNLGQAFDEAYINIGNPDDPQSIEHMRNLGDKMLACVQKWIPLS